MGAANLVSATDGHIQVGSAAINFGNPDNPISYDHDSEPRGALPDIGCDELP